MQQMQSSGILGPNFLFPGCLGITVLSIRFMHNGHGAPSFIISTGTHSYSNGELFLSAPPFGFVIPFAISCRCWSISFLILMNSSNFFVWSLPFANSLGPQVGGFVKHSGDPWHSDRWQSSWRPFRLSHAHPLYKIPLRNSQDLERFFFFFLSASSTAFLSMRAVK